MARPHALLLVAALAGQNALLGRGLSLTGASGSLEGRQPVKAARKYLSSLPPACLQAYAAIDVDLSDPSYVYHCTGPESANMCVIYCNNDYAGEESQYMCSYGSLEYVRGAAKPVCAVKNCTGLSGAPEGVVHNCGDGVAVGRFCEATCADGYRYTSWSGSQMLMCGGANRPLTGELPECVRASCTVPPYLEGTDCPGKKLGEKCSTPCSKGYSGGPMEMECTLNGFIPARTGASCTPNKCNSIPGLEPQLNITACIGAATGETCSIACNDGYRGDPQVYFCLETGDLVGAPPLCEATTP